MASETYAALIRMSKDLKEAALAPFRVREMRSKAHLEITKLESAIAEKESEITTAQGAYPIDFDLVIKRLDEKALIERRLKQFREIVTLLFPDDEV
jgi:hypothetical protein